MIKARVGLEETYAKGLEKVANQVGKHDAGAGWLYVTWCRRPCILYQQSTVPIMHAAHLYQERSFKVPWVLFVEVCGVGRSMTVLLLMIR